MFKLLAVTLKNIPASGPFKAGGMDFKEMDLG